MYTNLLGIAPMLIFASMGKEYSKLYNDLFAEGFQIPPASIPLMLLGCAAGTGIGYSSWWCRDKVSATSFTIIGVMNKCLTILLNCLVWDNHAPPMGIAALFLCLVGGSVYQQAPMREVKRHPKSTTVGGNEIWEDDLTELGGHDEPEQEESVELLNMRKRQDASKVDKV
jgi:solute carrier family 35 protein